MLRSVRSQALFVVLASFIASVAVSACPQPTLSFVDVGGLCVDPWLGDPYCTQPTLTQNGGCNGPLTATKRCVLKKVVADYPKWEIRYPTLKTCEGNACDNTMQMQTLRYNLAYADTVNCTTASNEPCESP